MAPFKVYLTMRNFVLGMEAGDEWYYTRGNVHVHGNNHKIWVEIFGEDEHICKRFNDVNVAITFVGLLS